MSEMVKSGLRDRKRLQKRQRIEAAAVELVLRDGWEAATVEAISERAEVSARTFFNYYANKESAVMGIPLDADDERELDSRLAAVDLTDADPVVVVVRIIMAAAGAYCDENIALRKDRLRLMRQHPQIMSGQFAQLNARKSRLMHRVTGVLADHEHFTDSRPHAVLVLSLCAAAVRTAFDEWAREPDTTDIQHAEQRAVALVHDTVRRLA